MERVSGERTLHRALGWRGAVLAGLKPDIEHEGLWAKAQGSSSRRQGQQLSVIPPPRPSFIPVSIMPRGKRAELGVFIGLDAGVVDVTHLSKPLDVLRHS